MKGVSEPVNVYEVIGLGPLRTRLQRSAGRGLTKFVGREREMAAMAGALEQAKSGHGQIVAAVGEAGAGKSRLMYEFKATIPDGCKVLEAYSVSHGKASAWLPVLELLKSYFKIADEDNDSRRSEKVEAKVRGLDPALAETLPHILGLLGIAGAGAQLAMMDGRIRRRRTLEALKRIVMRESLNQPLVVIFEDLHWIDEATQEFLNLLAGSLGTAKILLLVNYRPEYSHQWNSKTYYTQLRLDPLGKESADEMLTALLGDEQDLIPLKRLVIERTEGTPFFMEEMVQVLFEERALVRNGAVHLARPLDAPKVPATVQGILASRMDRLPPDEKELLQMLAVLGREFALSLVRRVVDGKADDDLERRLADLQMAEFIYEQPAIGDVEYVFKHALTQEVAYNALLVERRKLLHERAGEALESMFAGQLEDHLDDLARHYCRSSNVEKAIEYLNLAGEQASARSSYGEALSHFETALELLKNLSDTSERARLELTLRLAFGRAGMAGRGYAAAEVGDCFARALALCERVGATSEKFSVLEGVSGFYVVRSEIRNFREVAEKQRALAESLGDPKLIREAYLTLGDALSWMGEFAEARQWQERSISLYQPDERFMEYWAADSLLWLRIYNAWVLWYLGYPNQAREAMRLAVVRADRLSHFYSIILVRIWAAFLALLCGDISACEENTAISLASSREHGFPSLILLATMFRAWAMIQRGRIAEAIAELRENTAAQRTSGSFLAMPVNLGFLALASLKAGLADQGLAAISEALEQIEKSSERRDEAEIHRLKGELLLMQRKATEAESSFRQAIEIACRQQAKSWELRATISLARLLQKQGRRDEARGMLAEIYGWFTEGFDTADLKDAKALLDELSN